MLLAVVNRFLHWMVVGVISPVMVLMIGSKGVTLGEVGLIMAILSAFVVVFELPSGIISDRIGRKRIYLLSMMTFLASFVLLLFTQGFLPIAISFGLFGAARAFSSGSIESDFIDQYLTKHGSVKLSRLIMGMSLGETLGLAIGAVLGGFLPMLTRMINPSVNQFSGNILVQIVLVVVLIAVTLFTHHSAQTKKGESIFVFLEDAISMVSKNVVLVVLLVGGFIWGFSFFALEVYWQPQLKEILGGSDSTEVFGYLNGGYFVASAIGSLVATALISMLKLRNLVVVGLLRIVLGLGLVLLAIQSGLSGFAIVYIVMMGFNGMLSLPENTAFNLAIPEDKRSSLLSLSSLVVQLGGIAASLLFSAIVSSVGIPVVLMIAGGIFCLSSILYFFVDKNLDRANR